MTRDLSVQNIRYSRVYASGEPIWDVVARYLRAKKRVAALKPQTPRLIGVEGNPGIA